MNRSLRPFVLLLGLLSLPALAGEGLGSESHCPARKAGSDVTAPASEEGSRRGTPPAAATGGRAGGEAAAGNQRVRPRWQSFLPGMIR